MACVMSASDYYSKGNAAFVQEDYRKAIELYNQAIELDDACSEYYANRGHAFLKLTKYEDCRADSNTALELGLKNGKIFYRKGVACYHLEDFEDAQNCFLLGKDYDDADSSTSSWLQKCEMKLNEQAKQNELSQTASSQSPVPAPAPQKIKHDWYQTEPDVCVMILMKNAKSEDMNVDYTENTLKCCIKRGEDIEDYKLELNLAHTVIPDQCSFKIQPSKIEIRLRKAEGLQWSSLEAKATEAGIKHFTPVGSSVAAANPSHAYPSSSAKKRDWDRIVVDINKDEEKETQAGEGAVNCLFQKIYAEGSDEVKKAMNKSFTESGGTVLSTNWKDIGGKKVEVKPPDGMEWRTWES